jgi:glycerol kinase
MRKENPTMNIGELIEQLTEIRSENTNCNNSTVKILVNINKNEYEVDLLDITFNAESCVTLIETKDIGDLI